MSGGNQDPLVEFCHMKEYEGCKKIEFCQNSRYLAIYGFLQIQILDIEGENGNGKPYIIESYEIDLQKFNAILDIQI